MWALALCCNRTSFSCLAGHVIISMQTKKKQDYLYNSEEVYRSYCYWGPLPLQIIWHDTNAPSTRQPPLWRSFFVRAPKMCSVIWSLQKSHLTQIRLVIWCFCKSHSTTANSNISLAEHRQLEFTWRMQVTPLMWVGQGQSGIESCKWDEDSFILLQICYNFFGPKSEANLWLPFVFWWILTASHTHLE